MFCAPGEQGGVGVGRLEPGVPDEVPGTHQGRGMRKLFSRAGYEVVLVDEFRTSCTCFGCEGGACEKFKSVVNPRPWMREKRPTVLRNGLLSCQNCKRLWNRDRNGSLNIMRCAQAARRGDPRPTYMTRNFSEARSAVTAQGEGLPTAAGLGAI